jgi:hypothetical protein
VLVDRLLVRVDGQGVGQDDDVSQPHSSVVENRLSKKKRRRRRRNNNVQRRRKTCLEDAFN